ncbi:hypothetical protein GE061_016547 [Apolygus lucorum]|uniref:Reverse transcriptase Ty1/copia-type domain-containing protein n=1 Tax=Apolygus lucorum TaxID=248454 RepID=A0A8S9XGL8_APOLU|nr:hypothetical protein GE061_016547 [Apolygus lucorum]
MSQFNTKYLYLDNSGPGYLDTSGTLDTRLTYRRSDESLCGFVDANWCNCSLDRRSNRDMLLMSGAAISWESRKQQSVATFSTKAEYYCMTETIKDALNLKRFLRGLVGAIAIYNDNQGAQKQIDNTVHHSRTKHIDIKQRFIREAVDKEDVKFSYLSTEQMPADLLTKGIPRPRSEDYERAMGLTTCT